MKHKAMEGNNWNREQSYNRNYNRGSESPMDPSMYRGAYRLDTESRHHNETTYDGFDLDSQRRGKPRNYEHNNEQRPDY